MSATRRKRVTVVTGGHLSTCPRMLKAADALHAAGFGVRVVSTRSLDWAVAADRETRKTRDWTWNVIDYQRGSGEALRLWSGIRMRAASSIVDVLDGSAPFTIAARAYARIHPELVRAIVDDPGDLIYAGTGAALAAAAVAASRTDVPYALDLEDLYSGEHGDTDPARDALAALLEQRTLADARFLTTASEPMQAAYEARYRVSPTVLHNVVPLPRSRFEADAATGGAFRMYWFSQTIGAGRGLELVVQAAGQLPCASELHLRGREAAEYLETLRVLQRAVAPALSIVHHPPAPPDDMVRLCIPYDVGLATELPVSPNKRVCISNKIFTYLAAGLPVAASDTPGQRVVAEQDPYAVKTFSAGDPNSLAAILRCWAQHPPLLSAARRAAWQAAARRWHWEHADESGKLVALVRQAIGA